MMAIQCIIAEDEPLARDILETYINDHPALQLIGSCKDAFEVQSSLSEKPCDLLFLDINMPQVSGINLLRSLVNPPLVIFTTAYPEYAVEGYELSAVDYLLKPFSFERFLKAVNKAQTLLRSAEASKQTTTNNDFLFFKVDKKLKKVEVAAIRFAESIGDYVKLHTSSETLVLSESLRNLQEQLPEKTFFRIHKSYIVSLNHIEFVEGNYVRLGQSDLPIGASYREEFIEKLQEKNRKRNK
ncbi:LytTR family DNA-binding domain-containing protein [Pollutibacter soli]|uniref:LytR/AlgR family response regulator transcription factor n=1 Tax=Pollutibacter soli TaxID=3034157 RepID=UPI00301419FA